MTPLPRGLITQRARTSRRLFAPIVSGRKRMETLRLVAETPIKPRQLEVSTPTSLASSSIPSSIDSVLSPIAFEPDAEISATSLYSVTVRFPPALIAILPASVRPTEEPHASCSFLCRWWPHLRRPCLHQALLDRLLNGLLAPVGGDRLTKLPEFHPQGRALPQLDLWPVLANMVE